MGSLLSTPSTVKLLLRARFPPMLPMEPPTGLLTRLSSCPCDRPVVLMSTVFGASSARELTLPDGNWQIDDFACAERVGELRARRLDRCLRAHDLHGLSGLADLQARSRDCCACSARR